MHNLFFVTIPKDNCETSNDAKNWADDTLNDNGFVGEGYYSGGKADWFVIGGRWSGILTDLLAPRNEDGSINYCNRQNQYDALGAEDDAMILTEELADALIKEYAQEGECVEFYDTDDYEEYNISEIKNHIGKWIVVVDYHC